ncbi:thiamine-phosphate kinase [Microbacterium oleivorans]|uniref:Thiamine-monophosphate kinase n=1 Tax=Microbacterium oleivorans TaxID=273677 RepID=A0A177KE76_9MICO|nr:thiamine-phosphate kinase [Microbacterium oleivorans]OAH51434.1 thiamine-monophosphate kinase [Microbacterium oleivorans]
MGELRVRDVSEAELLRRILRVLGPLSRAEVGPGDDAAVLAVPGGRVVATTDTLVHGPDFRLAWTSPRDLGYKAAAVNLADVAAMGARPTALLVALALPDSLPAAFVDDLATGFRDALHELAPGCAVEGGDLTVSDTLTVAVTALGVLDGVSPVLRSGARPGDDVAVAGDLGAAARGLRLLFTRFRDDEGRPVAVDLASLTERERRDLSAQLRPQPPVRLGLAAARAGATALMDVSDGLVLDATRLADASEVTLLIEADLDDDALSGGEDHALLACFPAGTVPAGFTVIGRVAQRREAPVLIRGVAPGGRGGWDPYSDWDSALG